MNKDHPNYNAYIRILEEELVPAMGCTEPIALAYCAAKAREVLGCLPDKVVIQASGSIIKNVKRVIVPNTNHMKGIPAAAAALAPPEDRDGDPALDARAAEQGCTVTGHSLCFTGLCPQCGASAGTNS